MEVALTNNTDLKVFEPINEVENIISTLVENIYNEDAYQSYLQDLEESSETGEKKAERIKKTFSTIRVFNSNSDPLFLARDIGIILGVSNINTMIKNFNSSEMKIGLLDAKTKMSKKYFLTRHGIYRVLFNNRTKLSEVFRGFIYKLIDHMLNYEVDKLKGIINEFTRENPELVKESIVELNDNFKRYKQLYEKEVLAREKWELQATKENTLLKQLESEKNEVEIENMYNNMYIKQLKAEKMDAFERIYKIKYDNAVFDDNELIINDLKKKFLKEVYIYLVNPEVIDKVKEIDLENENEDERKFVEKYKFEYEFNAKIIEHYKRIDLEDLLYLRISFKKEDNEKFLYMTSDYLYDKAQYQKLIDILKTEAEYYTLSKKTPCDIIFKTTVEHVKMTAKSLLVPEDDDE